MKLQTLLVFSCVLAKYAEALPVSDNFGVLSPGKLGVIEEQNPEERAVGRSKYRWPDNKVIYKLKSNVGKEETSSAAPSSPSQVVLLDGLVATVTLDKATQDKMDHAMTRLSKITCITFIKADDRHKYWVDVNSDKNICSSSVVGFQNAAGGSQQQITLGSGCSEGNILHVLLHTLGFYHEHQRYDRDDYITINTQNIKSGHSQEFEIKSKRDTITYSLQYNYDSIMHYNALAFSSNGKETIVVKTGHPESVGDTKAFGQRKKLSNGDIKLIQRAYSCDSGDDGPLNRNETDMQEDDTNAPSEDDDDDFGGIDEYEFPFYRMEEKQNV